MFLMAFSIRLTHSSTQSSIINVFNYSHFRRWMESEIEKEREEQRERENEEFIDE